MAIKHICFFSSAYPQNGLGGFTFVRELICHIADMGIECSVIAPQSVSKRIVKNIKLRKTKWLDITDKGNVITVYQPRMLTFGYAKVFDFQISTFMTALAIERCYRKNKVNADAIYSHFWPKGIVAGKIAQQDKIPFFVASGESKIIVDGLYQKKTRDKFLSHISGIIYVSSKNKVESETLGLDYTDNIIVLPNAIDQHKFYSKSKNEVRDILTFNKNDFIIAFTGRFNHRKGVLRLVEAVKKVHGVKIVYIGLGELVPPPSNQILFVGKLPHHEIVNYLNAADIFVLPTLVEGCSNAIVEALACGLPIVSSNLSFNDDILNERNSIRVDSNDIDQIAEAITYLRDNPRIVEKMSIESLKTAENLTLAIRAKRILEFMNRS